MSKRHDADRYRALLLDAYAWFEERIGHDGAPDGGDPHWVTEAEELIGREQSGYGPDWADVMRAELEADRG